LARRPMGEVLEVEIAAGRARIFGMDVQIGVETHGMARPMVSQCARRSARRTRSGNHTIYLRPMRGGAKATVWIKPLCGQRNRSAPALAGQPIGPPRRSESGTAGCVSAWLLAVIAPWARCRCVA